MSGRYPNKRGGKRPSGAPFRRAWKRFDVALLILAVTLVCSLLKLYAPADPGPVSVSTAGPALAVQKKQPAPRKNVAKGGAPVRFLMHNVQNYFVQGEVQRSRYTNYPKREADREAVADTIASVKPEIVGLVEIGGPLALDDLADRLALRGLEYPHRFVLTREGEDRALAVLSKYPIVRNDSQANYGLFGTHNRKMLRGILDVTIRVEDGREFRILGAHLKSHKGNTEDSTQSLRTQEARTLALYVQKITKESPGTPILVYGDWNDGPSDSSLTILRQGSSKDSALTRLKPKDDHGEEWTHHYTAGGEYLIYDQIYVNAPLHSRMGNKSESGIAGRGRSCGSDHRAVWCELR